MAERPVHTAWVGSAGTATAFGVVRAIRAGWGDRVRIVAADINPPHLVASASRADACVQVPLVADPGFAGALVDGLERAGADTYVPLLVDEIALAAGLARAGRLDGVALLAPSAEAAELCADKWRLAAWLAEREIPAPPTALAAEARWDPAGLVVKSRHGEGSRAVLHVDSEAGLAGARARGDGAIAQRRCAPPEVTIDAFRATDGALFRAACRERLEVKAGVATKARVFADAELEALARQVAEGLDLRGGMTIQAMRGPAGWEVTDVNPRVGGGSPLSAAVGFDVAAAALADLWGEDPEPYVAPLAGEAWVVRHFEEVVLRRSP